MKTLVLSSILVISSQVIAQEVSKGECPMGHGSSKKENVNEESKTTNDHWWPNQLNVDLLRQNSELSNPMGADFDYVKALSLIHI